MIDFTEIHPDFEDLVGIQIDQSNEGIGCLFIRNKSMDEDYVITIVGNKLSKLWFLVSLSAIL